MNYAIGCAFNLDEMLMNFPYKKLKITCKECDEIIGNNHRNILVKKIFIESVKLVLKDIIENNVTFWLPLTGSVKCNIHMKRVTGTEFQNSRKNGKWKDIDIMTSMFSGYELGFYMMGNRTPRTKNIYLNKELTKIITENCNKGMQYGDSNNDKIINDYYEEIYLMFPSVSKQDINRILKFSWKSLYLHNSYGGDVFLKGSGLWCYIGTLTKNSLRHFYYYIRKLSAKIRILYKRNKTQWDGYYYFALCRSQYEQYLSQKNKRGRPKKYYTFNNIMLYKIKDECRLNEHNKEFIFRIPYISQINYKFYLKTLKTDKAECILERDPMKFKDILIHENEYEFL